MLKFQEFFRRHMAFWFCAFCLLVSSANGQTQTPSPTPSPQAEQEDAQQSPPSKELRTVSDSQDEVISVAINLNVDQPKVRELGSRGSWFSDNVDWLHWGPVGIRSAEVYYLNFSQDATAAAAAGAPGSLSAAIFQTDLAYSRRLQHSRLILQYSPRILVVDGYLSRQLSNQDGSLDLLFAPTPHLTLGVNDWLSYYGQNNVLNDRILDLNRFSGTISNPFLNNGQRTLMNSVSLPLTYNTSARTSLSVSPLFNYAKTFGNGNTGAAASVAQPLDVTMLQYGATAQINHAVSSNQSLGVFYTYQGMQQGVTTDTTFHSFGATASRRLGHGFYASGEFGASYSFQGPLKAWTGIGSVTLSKAFRHSSIEATYGRSVLFSGYVGSGYSNYAWVNLNRQFGRKTSVSAGFGYLTAPTLDQQANGKYVDGSISYMLFRNVSCFAGYSRFWQSGKGVQLTTGTQAQIQAGLRWASMRRVGNPDYARQK